MYMDEFIGSAEDSYVMNIELSEEDAEKLWNMHTPEEQAFLVAFFRWMNGESVGLERGDVHG